MGDRFTLLYRFSTDYGLTWTDLTPQVDSRQTSITQNLCTNNFTSAKDEATFVMPETPLFEPDGTTPTPKKLLMDALLGDDDILIEINAPGSVDVLWDNEDVLWNGEHVQWHGSVRYFTGYADRSAMDLRSYPLPPRLTVKVQDVSVLHLDDKVDRHVLLENNKISQIVAALLGYAGYVNIGSTALDNADDETLEAFVVDKDDADTYRQYIDTLLFEAGGYVLDFNEYGQANVVHLKWDGSDSASRTIDNPMNANGVAMKGRWLKEDGVSVKWSSLAWTNQRIWMADITQEMGTGGLLKGVTVQSGHYWPENGELDPVYMEYDAKLLDAEYLTRASRRQNKDLTIIMAKNMSAVIQATQNGSAFTGWTRVDPQTWPAGDNWNDKYGIPTNPTYWPTKAWHLLYNGTGSDVNLTFFSLSGDVLYRNKINTVDTSGSKNPKEYQSTYIYNQSHAERFAQFWWHFLQTSRYQFSWSEPNRRSPLNDVVAVGVKGNNSTQKALIAGKTHTWINDNVEIISYTAVGIDTYTPASLVPISVLPSSTKEQKQTTVGAKTATFSTTPSYTLSQWENFVNVLSTWTITNASSFNVGDTAIINGTISDMDDLPIKLYLSVSDVTSPTISGTGIEIRYTPVTENWDFAIEQSAVPRNDRIPWSPNDSNSYTDIHLTSLQKGYGVLEYWSCTGTSSPLLTYFVGANAQTTTGSTPILRIYKQETYDEIKVTMHSLDNVHSITKVIKINNETEYDHDFGAWEPSGGYQLPDHFTVGGVDYDVIPGDFFVAKSTFTTGGDTYSEGVPYEYKNNSWHNEVSASAENAPKLLSCLGNVLSDPNIQPSTAAIYGWFENLVAKNAVISNLFSQKIVILDNGCIHSDYYDDDGNVNLTATASLTHFQAGSNFTVTLNVNTFLSACVYQMGTYEWECDDSNAYWDKKSGNPLSSGNASVLAGYGIAISGTTLRFDKIVITVSPVSDAASGFWLGANGELKCYSATAQNMTISGSSTFKGTFDCAAIRSSYGAPTVANTATASTISSSQAANLRTTIANIGYADNTKYACRIQGVSSPVAYMSMKYSVEGGGFGVTIYTNAITFYDSYFNPVDIATVLSCTRNTSPQASRDYTYGIYRRNGGGSDNYCYANSSFTIEFLIGGNTLTLTIPESGSGLSSGQLFSGPVTTVGGVSCRPIYMKS